MSLPEYKTMSEAMQKEFPNADYLFAVTLTEVGENQVSAHVHPKFTTLATTDLTNMELITEKPEPPIRLLPRDATMVLRIITPDATVAYCTNRPRWTWTSVNFLVKSTPS